MSLFGTVFLIWALALCFALLESALLKKNMEKQAKYLHLAVLGSALILAGKFFGQLMGVLQALASY